MLLTIIVISKMENDFRYDVAIAVCRIIKRPIRLV